MVRVGNIFTNDDGVNVATEYILVFMISVFVFTILISTSQSIFIDGPGRTVTKNQLMDIGNDVDAKLIDTYLLVPQDKPDSISIATQFDIPSEIAGYGYDVEISDAPTPGDKEVTIKSDRSGDLLVRLTLNGVSSTIPVHGSTGSHNAEHSISYQL